MKKQTTLTAVLLFTLVALAFTTGNLKAQTTKVYIEKYDLPENAVKSLIVGIKSENTGLRKSAIFFAGQYKLEEAVDYLVEALQKEKDQDTKILIALSLFKIGDPIAIDYIKNLEIDGSAEKVKTMFTTIYNEFAVDKSIMTAESK